MYAGFWKAPYFLRGAISWVFWKVLTFCDSLRLLDEDAFLHNSTVHLRIVAV